jgi:hypothetical protein
MTVMFAPKLQSFLGALTMATAAGVLRVQSPFSAIPPSTFPGGAGSRPLPLPASPVNAWLMNRDFAADGTADAQSPTFTDRDGVQVNVLQSGPIAFH